MKKDTRNMILIGAALFALYVIMNRNRQQVQQPQNYPMYPQGSPAWVQWAQSIITAAGGLADQLFGPGGPFERKSKAEVRKAIEQGNATNEQAYYFYN